MKKLFTLFFSLSICSLAMAQLTGPVGYVFHAGCPNSDIIIDGSADEFPWMSDYKFEINKPINGETPSLGDVGTTYWKARWFETGMYFLVVVNDNEWNPWYANDTDDVQNFDKINLYIDVNPVLKDGKGGSAGAGNWQISLLPVEGAVDGTPQTITVQGGNVTYAYKVNGSAWNVECFIPWESIPDLNGNNFDIGAELGFDCEIVDSDVDPATPMRAVWANDGTGPSATESWTNMDDIGYLIFEGGCVILIESITLTADNVNVDTDNGVCQLTADVIPADHTQSYKYVILGGTSTNASVSATGVVSSFTDGTVIVRAMPVDEWEPASSNEITVTFSNQVVTESEISVLKNDDFTLGDNGLQSWDITPGRGSIAVEDGWGVMKMVKMINRWDIALSQRFPVQDATTVYKLKFKAKASADMTIDFVIEDVINGYRKDAYCAISNTPELVGSSDWQLPLTTEAKWFTLDVTFPNKLYNSRYSIVWQGGLHNGTFYVDSVTMYTEANMAFLLSTATTNLASNNQFSVYPNPVGSAKYISVKLSNPGGNISIYNALGQKLTERIATSTIEKFDVADYKKGLYFIKISDGSVQKFIK
jgi:hypothetical protein